MEYYLGVFHTTFPAIVVNITEFQGILYCFRKANMIPSAFAGKKNPQLALRFKIKAARIYQRK
jgi:hypothetical protein